MKPHPRGHDEHLRALEEEYAALTYAVSHDLQEPVRMVVGFMELLEHEHGSRLDEEARGYVAFAADGARRLQGMLDALVQLSRACSDPVERASVDPVRAWRVAQSGRREAIEQSGAQVSEDALPEIAFDQRQLEALLAALLDNALAFAGPGVPRVRLLARESGPQITLCVEDGGIGLPRHQRERALRPFTTLHPDHPRRGVGMGLCLAHRMVQRNGGRLWLEDNEPQGLRVCFTARVASEEGG